MSDDLAEFAKARKFSPGPPCWGCNIPEADVIAKHYRAGMAVSVITAWLRERRGYTPGVATRNKIDHHLKEHVGRPTAAAGKRS